MTFRGSALLPSAERDFESGTETQWQRRKAEYRIVVLAAKIFYHGKQPEVRIQSVTAAEVDFLPRRSKIAIRQQQGRTEKSIAQKGAVIAPADQVSDERKI